MGILVEILFRNHIIEGPEMYGKNSRVKKYRWYA